MNRPNCFQKNGESAVISFTIAHWPQHVEKYFVCPIRYAIPLFHFFLYKTEYQNGAEDPIRHGRAEGMFFH